MNLGLRWDYFGVIGEKNNLLSNFDPASGLVLVGSPGLPRLYQRDWNNFSPRLGLAWDLNGKGKTVLRAGWGLFYDAFSQDFFAGQLPFNTFNPGPAFNPVGPAPILFSFSTVQHDSERRADLQRLPRLRRVRGRSKVAYALRAKLQSQSPTRAVQERRFGSGLCRLPRQSYSAIATSNQPGEPERIVRAAI